MTTHKIKEFIETSPFSQYLESCWNGNYYLSFPVRDSINVYDPTGVIAHALLFNVYSDRLKLKTSVAGRSAAIASWIVNQINESGYTITQDGFTDHPAANSTMADALGTLAYYAADVGLDEELKAKVINAMMCICEKNHRIRYPEGAMGKTQQLRFELRVYYWAWLLTGKAECKKRFFELFDNGIKAYTEKVAMDGFLTEPSIYPDWTWNYAIVGSCIREYATNTHTPAYYCTEPNGFMFVYLHGIRNGFIARNDRYDMFCRKYIKGLFRNLSRNGHLASDLDGYGIHRAWYSPVLIEGIPVEAVELAAELGMTEEAEYLRWYMDRYIDYVMSAPEYSETGLPGALPYGHRIGIEDQFSQLACTRFYASLVRYLNEHESQKEIKPSEPDAFGSFAWHAQWLRISTPAYETSFVGATSLRNIPVVKNFGDPHLGTLIGGAPLTTLFVGEELMYSAASPLESLWNIQVVDHNGRIVNSAATSFEDNTHLTVRHSNGDMLDAQSFEDYEATELMFIKAKEYIESSWNRFDYNPQLTFSVKNRYLVDMMESYWSVRARAGHFIEKINFCIPVPAESAECCCEGQWKKLQDADEETIPQMIRWRIGKSLVTISIKSFGAANPVLCRFVNLPVNDGMPGGINSFCPYPLVQVTFEITPAVKENRWLMHNSIRFESN